MTKEIELTQGKVALVDDEDYERINQHKWCAAWIGYTWYAIRTDCSEGKKKNRYMHREILNAPEGIQVDHKNGDGLFNCKENLRLCTHQENGFNRRQPNKNSESGIKGVHWDRNAKKFRAQINIKGRKIHLGYFNVSGDADSAYRIAEEKYFGEFGRK